MSQRQLQNNHNKPSYPLSPDSPGGASGNAGAQEIGVPSLGKEDPLRSEMWNPSSVCGVKNWTSQTLKQAEFILKDRDTKLSA